MSRRFSVVEFYVISILDLNAIPDNQPSDTFANGLKVFNSRTFK